VFSILRTEDLALPVATIETMTVCCQFVDFRGEAYVRFKGYLIDNIKGISILDQSTSPEMRYD
jgi:hypothetical protein